MISVAGGVLVGIVKGLYPCNDVVCPEGQALNWVRVICTLILCSIELIVCDNAHIDDRYVRDFFWNSLCKLYYFFIVCFIPAYNASITIGTPKKKKKKKKKNYESSNL